MAQTVTQISAPLSARKRVRYNPNARIYPNSSGSILGLEDDIVAVPDTITAALRRLIGGNAGENKLIGGEIVSYSSTQIVTAPGYILTDSAIYYLEPLTLTPDPLSFWGFYEIELAPATDSDSVTLDFWDDTTSTPYSQTAAQRREYRISVFENFETTAAYPPLTAGRIKWLEFQRDSQGGTITAADLVEKNLFIDSNNNLILPADPTLPMGAATRQYVDGSGIGRGFPLAFLGTIVPAGFYELDGQAISRAANPITFGLFGETFGAGDGVTTFQIPDARGAFLRGHGSQVFNTRTKSSGAAVGDFQEDQFQGHWHRHPGTGPGSTNGMNNGFNNNLTQNGVQNPMSDGVNGTPRTGSETFPFNIAVKWLIRAG